MLYKNNKKFEINPQIKNKENIDLKIKKKKNYLDIF
jgi:hypothetical protein